jgi:ABC-type protease/lipase transport system fused ATPase/permease subunit
VECEDCFAYTSDETNANVSYVNTHAQLEVLRDEALASNAAGPRVMIVGPPESGKSSLAKILVAYGKSIYNKNVRARGVFMMPDIHYSTSIYFQ